MSSVPSVGKYRLIRKLAAGGMAEVFLAQQEGAAGFAKTVVLKRILPHLAEDPQFVRMFLAEARLAAQLDHPNIVHIFDLGEYAGIYFIVMEYVDGLDLRSMIECARQAARQIPVEIALKIVSHACEALSFAHDFADPTTGQPMHLVHRDVTADNILVSRQGAVKLVDFGIARAASQPHLTENGVLKGKLPYMAPEQVLAEELNCQTDLWALGVVLFELITGARPFVAENEVALMTVITDENPLRVAEKRVDAPAGIQEILDRTFAKPRKNRYRDAHAMQSDIDELLHSLGRTVSAKEIGALCRELAPPPLSTSLPPLPASAPKTGSREKPITLVKRKKNGRTVPPPPPPDDETDPGGPPPTRTSQWPRALAVGAGLLGMALAAMVALQEAVPDEEEPAPPAAAIDASAAAVVIVDEPAVDAAVVPAPEPQERPPAPVQRRKPEQHPDEDVPEQKDASVVMAASSSSAPLQAPVVIARPKGLACPRGMALIPAKEQLAAFCIDLYEAPNTRTDLPISDVTWYSAQERCKQRGARLCEATEWEYACRGPGGTRYPYGNTFDDAHCNASAAGPEAVRAASELKGCRSVFGPHHLSGNVAEWTSTGSGNDRVVMGGDATSKETAAACNSQKAFPPTSRSPLVGFRCCAHPHAEK